jgi:hypothetical protein
MNGQNNLGNGRAPPRSFTLQICDPVIVNAGVFITYIALDFYNANRQMVPVHAVIGIVITILLLVLCKNNMNALAWIVALVPAIFVAAAIIYAFTHNKYVLSAEDLLGKGVTQASAAANVLGQNLEYGYNTVYSAGDQFNQTALDTYKNTSAAANNAWNSVFNEQIAAGATPAAAAVAATAATSGTPPEVKSDAKETVDAVNSVIVNGEYTYLCGANGEGGNAALSESCKIAYQICKGDPICQDRQVSTLAVNAICLGGLATGGAPPSNDKRDACLACKTDECRTSVMKGDTTASTAATVAQAVTSALVANGVVSAAAPPVTVGTGLVPPATVVPSETTGSTDHFSNYAPF